MPGLLVSGTTLAQEQTPIEQVCGPPYEKVSTSEKGKLDAQAQTLFKIGSGELQGAAEKARTEIMVNANRSDASRQLLYLNHLACVLIYQDKSLSLDDKLKRIQALASGLLESDLKAAAEDLRNKLIGQYQVRLGPKGGCNGGKPLKYPEHLAKITKEVDKLTSYNECDTASIVRIVDEKTMYFFKESAEIDQIGSGLIIWAQDGNSWQKVRD
jgi:hypothetical protein